MQDLSVEDITGCKCPAEYDRLLLRMGKRISRRRLVMGAIHGIALVFALLSRNWLAGAWIGISYYNFWGEQHWFFETCTQTIKRMQELMKEKEMATQLLAMLDKSANHD